MPAHPTRPPPVLVIAAFLFAATLIAVVAGTTLIFPSRFSDWLWELNRPARTMLRPLGSALGAVLIALGVGTALTGMGLWRGRRWAWWLAVLLFTVNGCGEIVSFFMIRDFVRSGSGLAIAAVFLFYLNRANVRRFFAAAE
ncbi:MAG: hypothetical protein LAP38_20630 [Acidobacteriia bacterium]|nr:hypothetical protein [Terriglobia bacterium]